MRTSNQPIQRAAPPKITAVALAAVQEDHDGDDRADGERCAIEHGDGDEHDHGQQRGERQRDRRYDGDASGGRGSDEDGPGYGDGGDPDHLCDRRGPRGGHE